MDKNFSLCKATLVVMTLLTSACAVHTQPYTQQEREQIVSGDIETMFASQEPISGPLSLAEAMARALKYNLDARVRQMETAIAQGQSDLSRYEMLPQLTTQAGYTKRSNTLASRSQVLDGSGIPDFASTSQDRERTFSDIELVWNVLDFGVGFYSAHQDADHALIAEERRKKAIDNLLQQVRTAFWRAAAAQRIEPELVNVLKDARSALAYAEQIEKNRLRSPLQSLRYQRSLLTLIEQLESLESEMQLARTELSALINLPPNIPFVLDLTEQGNEQFHPITDSLDALELLALTQRPELAEEIYNARISQLETKKAMLRMLPGFEFSLGWHSDSNSFLENNQWSDVGALVSWNLFNIFKGPASIRHAEQQEQLVVLRRQALNLAVITQVHLAYHQYHSRLAQLKRNADLSEIDSKIQKQTAIIAANQAGNEMEQVGAATTALISRLKMLQSIATVQDAYGRLLVSLGFNLSPATVEDYSIDSLTREINEHLTQLKLRSFQLAPTS